MNHKVKSYIGFAVKANKVTYGIDNVLKSPQDVSLVLYDSSLSDNAVHKVKYFCDRHGIVCIQLQYLIQDLVYKSNCKVVGIRDDNFSRTILDSIN